MRPLALIALLLAPSLASAQDVVRLKNGRVLAGEIAASADDAEGFTITLWESGAKLKLPWELVSADEKRRLTRAEPVAAGPMVEATIVITRHGDYHRGILVREEGGLLHLKERGRAQPTPVLISIIERRSTEMRPELDLYTPLEILQLRAAKASVDDADAQLALAETAVGWKLFGEAAGHYEAAAAAAQKKNEADPRAAGWETLAKEMKARLLLATIDEKRRKLDFDGAKALADEIQAKYADTPTGAGSKELAPAIEAEKAEFMANRDKVMLARVVEAWPGERNNQLNRAVTAAKKDIQAAMAKIPEIDKLIAEALAREFNVTAEEVSAWWMRRGETVGEDTSKKANPAGTTPPKEDPNKKKLRRFRAAYATGTWIVRGGQDGGSDFIEFADAQAQQQGKAGGKAQPQQGGGKGGRAGNPQANAQQAQYDEELETSAVWWSRQSFGTRRQWLEAYYADNSQMVTVEEVRVDGVCGNCGGSGTKNSTRAGRKCRVKCPRCHQHGGVDSQKRVVELSVVYF
jgi:hypothetical protein